MPMRIGKEKKLHKIEHSLYFMDAKLKADFYKYFDRMKNGERK